MILEVSKVEALILGTLKVEASRLEIIRLECHLRMSSAPYTVTHPNPGKDRNIQSNCREQTSSPNSFLERNVLNKQTTTSTRANAITTTKKPLVGRIVAGKIRFQARGKNRVASSGDTAVKVSKEPGGAGDAESGHDRGMKRVLLDPVEIGRAHV